MALIPNSTDIKLRLNKVLNLVGLQVGTTVSLLREEARIQALQALGHWTKVQYHQGLKFDSAKHLNFLRETCLPFEADYTKLPHSANGSSPSFYLDNGNFRAVDAELLYSVIRKQQPKQIIEVGSGFSTRLMALAIKDGNLSTSITSIDPEPRVEVDAFVTQRIESVVEHVDSGTIADVLEEGDILFIDSSHQVITGGDVPFLFLEVLPRLKKGVFIHVHDVFFPFDYPVECVSAGWGWTEQYLVHAFLSFNEAFEILWPARYMWANHQRALLEVIPANLSVYPPSSLWLLKTA